MGDELSISYNDLVTGGAGYLHEGDKDQGVATVTAGVVAAVEKHDKTAFVKVAGRGIFAQEGSRAGISLGVYGVPGIMGAFAGPQAGVDFDLSSGDAKIHAGGELGAFLPIGGSAVLLTLGVEASNITGATSLGGVSTLLSLGGSFSKL